jgi:arylamine N-acetyltransferase
MSDGPSPSLALGAYLARLGHAGGRVPTWHVLAALHLAHATHIPFENLDTQLAPKRWRVVWGRPCDTAHFLGGTP